MNPDYEPCHYCGRYNHKDLTRCSWCYKVVMSKKQRLITAIVFWGSVAGILAAVYVAFRLGGS